MVSSEWTLREPLYMTRFLNSVYPVFAKIPAHNKKQFFVDAAAVIEDLRRRLDVLDSMYTRVVSVALRCDPIPADERVDGELEPPWEVFERVRRERDAALERLAILDSPPPGA